MYRLIAKICLGLWVAMNLVVCIVTTDPLVLGLLNALAAAVCLALVGFIESRASVLAADLGISRPAAKALIADYFGYYRSVERISIYEYFEKVAAGRE